ncbi:ATP-binding protein [Nonomuraea guangzhouensis]|uniref:ATP-binding protein n=1 Tax=Nonomuraea guangzhouensis TaxID=1291555 RepID=A0ABW4GEL0_9ACTN|nr:ATP-binding protein [Nonomuraea guangzhouensis]
MPAALQSPAHFHTFTMNDVDPRAIPARARATITSWVGTDHPRAFDLQTLATELVTNAIRYGLGTMPATRWVRMSLEREASFLRLAVIDPGHANTFPHLREPVNDPRPDDEDAAIEGGRGLHVVQKITNGCWGHYYNVQNEQVVWALVPLR